jgi:hypothetical protein
MSLKAGNLIQAAGCVFKLGFPGLNRREYAGGVPRVLDGDFFAKWGFGFHEDFNSFGSGFYIGKDELYQ